MFDLDRGVRFSTYARWWVKNAALASYHSMRCVVQQPSKAPGEEAAEPAPVTEGSLALLELPSTDPTPEEQMISSSSRAAIKRQLDGALGNLDPLGREVLVSRMLQQPPEPVSELAARLDISASKLRQLERRSMLRLRQDLISRGVHSSRVQ
jgi:RNA polymerase sigma-32 factor